MNRSSMIVVPRIDSTLVNSHAGKTVRIVGKVEVINSDNTVIFNSNGSMKFSISPDIELKEHRYFEVTASISDEGNNRIVNAIDIGDSINEKAVEALVKYSQKLPELF